jgi:hypothetical protein
MIQKIMVISFLFYAHELYDIFLLESKHTGFACQVDFGWHRRSERVGNWSDRRMISLLYRHRRNQCCMDDTWLTHIGGRSYHMIALLLVWNVLSLFVFIECGCKHTREGVTFGS